MWLVQCSEWTMWMFQFPECISALNVSCDFFSVLWMYHVLLFFSALNVSCECFSALNVSCEFFSALNVSCEFFSALNVSCECFSALNVSCEYFQVFRYPAEHRVGAPWGSPLIYRPSPYQPPILLYLYPLQLWVYLVYLTTSHIQLHIHVCAINNFWKHWTIEKGAFVHDR